MYIYTHNNSNTTTATTTNNDNYTSIVKTAWGRWTSPALSCRP